MKNIQMVDLIGQYNRYKSEIDSAIAEVLNNCSFINGVKVSVFAQNLAKYLYSKHVVPCANGTDALQISLMALNLKPGDEVIVPAFTYIATAEVLALLRLKPVMVDVDCDTFNISVEAFKNATTPQTKAVVPVHLYGQCAEMEEIIKIASEHNIYIIEDNAQAIGAKYRFSNGREKFAGTIGNVGCTSFFPSKNLGCYGDGGAIITNDDDLALKTKMIANHGQNKKYYHEVVGCNSRLDTLQAAILDVKLKYLNDFIYARQSVAKRYDDGLSGLDSVITPARSEKSDHVYHQYTLKVTAGRRDELKNYLEQNAIPSMIY